jgi:hypothetical protein
VTKRLVSKHAEDVGGFIVEPGHEFDEKSADAATVERLTNEGKLADVSPSKQTAGKGE